jgi:hypothetical protein
MVTKLPYLSDDHHFAIANVAAQAAELDLVLDSAVYLTIQPEQVSLYLVKNLGPDRLVEILKLALIAELPNYKNNISALFDRIKKCRRQRNEVLHWMHEAADSKDIVRFVDQRRGREPKPKDMTAKDIQQIADETQDCHFEIVEWFNLYNWHCEIRLHGTPEQLTHPPHWALPRKLRPPNKPPPRARQPRKPQR